MSGWVGLPPALALIVLAACSGGQAKSPAGDAPPGTVVSPGLPPGEPSERERVEALLAPLQDLDGPGLLGRYPASFAPALSYDPRAAAGLDLIRASHLGLAPAEEQALADKGFVISDRMKFPGFTYGYESIYADDLPLFVSADSILYAVHRSYDRILEQLETSSLRPALLALLQGLRAQLAGAGLDAQVARDIDLYLAVPLGLLTGTPPAPVAGAAPSQIAALITSAHAATGTAGLSLFGVTRTEDFSQYKPRGHYVDTPDLGTYFQASMWLGRIDFRMIETQADGTQRFSRRQFDGALALSSLVSGDVQAQWSQLARTIDLFVGEPDSMQVTDFPALLAALGVADLAGVAALDDATIAAAIVTGGFGAQRIASRILIAGVHDTTFPLDRSFLLLGQRYVVDSQVFSNVVYDRVPARTQAPRMMPDPLDVAFAALGNNQAASLLAPQLDLFGYAPELASTRALVDDHGDAFWGENLYNIWLSALRALSPVPGGASRPVEIAGTEAWGRRLLSAQLASWAELRHDTILYVKQSYTTGVLCAFPDALVEPAPDFFAAIGRFAAKGQDVVALLGLGSAAGTIGGTVSDYFTNLGAVAGTLKDMADAQVAGTALTDAQLAFINEAVKVQRVCGGGYATGWYARLFFGGDTATDFHPTIADVHTEPTDAQGNAIGAVLHVGTGYARLMVLTANVCGTPRAYAGVVSSAYSTTTTDLLRLDDDQWKTMLDAGAPDLPWMNDLIVRP